MWDGIENTRSGHSVSTSIWGDLIGNADLTLDTGVVVNDDNMLLNGTGKAFARRNTEIACPTCEIVLNIPNPIVAIQNNKYGIAITNGAFSSTTSFVGFIIEGRGTSTRPLGY